MDHESSTRHLHGPSRDTVAVGGTEGQLVKVGGLRLGGNIDLIRKRIFRSKETKTDGKT
jgi:hypothetical protein